MTIKPQSRAAEKLSFAIEKFHLNLENLVCADFGANLGGFTAIMLNNGAKKVYAVETGYGQLDWNLRNSDNVINMERTNAMNVVLPEKMDFISIDTSWTKQEKILPNAIVNLKPDGLILTLVKPHYEANSSQIHKGKLKPEFIPEILEIVKLKVNKLNLNILNQIDSPIYGKSKGNKEFLWLLSKNLNS